MGRRVYLPTLMVDFDGFHVHHGSSGYNLELPDPHPVPLKTRIMSHFEDRECHPKPSFVTVIGVGG